MPCSACLAGKLNKYRKQPVRNFTDIANLANFYNVPLSRTGATQDHNATPNTAISVDWGILNKKLKKDVNNVFLLILDIHTGLVFVFPAESLGQASEGLQAYIKKFGIPKEKIHDNAEEFIHGEFADLCTTQRNICPK